MPDQTPTQTKFQSLAAAWDDFAAQTIPPGLNPITLSMLKFHFYTGSLVMYGLLVQDEIGDPDAHARFINSLGNELAAFVTDEMVTAGLMKFPGIS